MKNIKFTKETLKRMLRTFAQAALAYLAVNIAFVDFSAEGEAVKTALKGLALATVAAGLSAVMNLERNTIIGEDEVNG